MGLINLGVPREAVEFLRQNMKLEVFVEGGTYIGDSAKLMSSKFRSVYTIEKSDKIYAIAEENLQGIKNIKLLKGDTRFHLEEILSNNDNILFWLDAHWSGGDTYGEDDECPLIEELEIIFKEDKKHIILIDDARLFLSPPPLPHRVENWPSMKDIISAIPSDRSVLVFEDVIFVYPESVAKILTAFIQKKVTNDWEKLTNDWENQGKKHRETFFKGIKMSIKALFKGNLF